MIFFPNVDCSVVGLIDLNSASTVRYLLVNEFLRITYRKLDKSGFPFFLSISLVAFQLLSIYSALGQSGIADINSKIQFNYLQDEK